MAEYPALDLIFPLTDGTPALLELLHGTIGEFEPTAIADHETGDGWRVFFRAASSRDAALEALRAAFGHRLVSLSSTNVPDDGWARRTQAQLTAVRVGRVVVAPPWAPEVAQGVHPTGDLVVVIEPSMGFGTGHHATTRLCLDLLQREGLDGRHVTDVGTGSGVLALAAWRLGAPHVTAVDCDPDALQNARENVMRNGAADGITLVESDLGALDLPAAGVVVANLTAAVLERHASTLMRLTAPGGRLIVSGFGPDERRVVERGFGLGGDYAVEGAWCAAAFDVTSAPRSTGPAARLRAPSHLPGG